MEGGWEVSTWEVFLPGWKFFFQAGTFSSRWEVFLPAGYFSFRLGVISFIPKFQWFRDYLMVLCCDMRSLCLPSIPPASYRLCGCLAIGDSYEKSYITKINNLGMTIYLFLFIDFSQESPIAKYFLTLNTVPLGLGCGVGFFTQALF